MSSGLYEEEIPPTMDIVRDLSSFRRLEQLDVRSLCLSGQIGPSDTVQDIRVIEYRACSDGDALDLSGLPSLQCARIMSKRAVVLPTSNPNLRRLDLVQVKSIAGDTSHVETLNIKETASASQIAQSCQPSLRELGLQELIGPVVIDATTLRVLFLEEVCVAGMTTLPTRPLDALFMGNVSFNPDAAAKSIFAKQILLSNIDRQQFEDFKSKLATQSIVGIAYECQTESKLAPSGSEFIDYARTFSNQLSSFGIAAGQEVESLPSLTGVRHLALLSQTELSLARDSGLSLPLQALGLHESNRQAHGNEIAYSYGMAVNIVYYKQLSSFWYRSLEDPPNLPSSWFWDKMTDNSALYLPQ